MRRFPALLLATLLALAPLPAQLAAPTPGVSALRLRGLTAALDEYVASGALVGGELLVLRDGAPIVQHAFGLRDREANDPMRLGTMYRIASQTKAIVSVAAMLLQEEGKLLLTHPVSRYLPEFTSTTVAVPRAGGGYDVVPAKRQITIRDLLTHTAGIGYGNGPAADQWKAAGIQGWYFADRSEPVSAVVKRMAALPMDAQPGERYVYGYSTDILGAVVEAASGMSLDALLRSRIFEPLKMRNTAFFLRDDQRDALATVYTSVNGRLERSPDPGAMTGQGRYASGPRVAFSGGAGLLSTASDYARFLQMLLNGGELDGQRILSPTTVALMTTNHVGSLYGADGFGLGVSVRTALGNSPLPGSVGEYGWGGAYHSTYWVDPAQRMVVVYMTNLNNTGGIDDHARIRAMVYGALVGK